MTDLLDPTAQEPAPPATHIYDTAPVARVARRPSGPRPAGPARPRRAGVAGRAVALALLWFAVCALVGFLLWMNPPAPTNPVRSDPGPATLPTTRATGSVPRGVAVPSRGSTSHPQAPAGGTAPIPTAQEPPTPRGRPAVGEARAAAEDVRPSAAAGPATGTGSGATAPSPASGAPAAPPGTEPATTTTTDRIDEGPLTPPTPTTAPLTPTTQPDPEP